MKYIKLIFFVFALANMFTLPSCSLFVVEQLWATGYFLEFPESVSGEVEFTYKNDGFTILMDWDSVAKAQQYRLNLEYGSITNEIIIENYESEYEVALVNILDPDQKLETTLKYTITPINNINEADKPITGEFQAFGDGTCDHPYRVIDRVTFLDIKLRILDLDMDSRVGSFLLLKDINLAVCRT